MVKSWGKLDQVMYILYHTLGPCSSFNKTAQTAINNPIDAVLNICYLSKQNEKFRFSAT